MEWKWWSRDYGDAAERRSSFALCRATEDKYDRGDQTAGVRGKEIEGI